MYQRLRELNTEVLGISVDSFASHKKFHDELKLPFDLLSDWDRKVTQEYGVFNFKEGVANRVSFLIDKKGIIRFKQEATLIKPRNIKEMIRSVEEVHAE